MCIFYYSVILEPMSCQIFKQQISPETLFALLDNLCVQNEKKYYVFNNISFKKGVFNNSLAEFIEACRPCYHISKRKYLDRKLCYSGFTTILRQICKLNQINYTSKVLYDKTNYDIVYYIYR